MSRAIASRSLGWTLAGSASKVTATVNVSVSFSGMCGHSLSFGSAPLVAASAAVLGWSARALAFEGVAAGLAQADGVLGFGFVVVDGHPDHAVGGCGAGDHSCDPEFRVGFEHLPAVVEDGALGAEGFRLCYPPPVEHEIALPEAGGVGHQTGTPCSTALRASASSCAFATPPP